MTIKNVVKMYSAFDNLYASKYDAEDVVRDWGHKGEKVIEVYVALTDEEIKMFPLEEGCPKELFSGWVFKNEKFAIDSVDTWNELEGDFQ